MTTLVKKGLFTVSLCALSVATALDVSATQYVKIGDKTQAITKTNGIITNIYNVTDKDGNLISQKMMRHFEKDRFIIEFAEQPLIQTKKAITREISRQFQNTNTSDIAQKAIIKSQLQQAEARLATIQQATIQQLSAIDKNIKVLNRFSRTSNAIVVEADRATLSAIKKLPNVKNVSRDTVVSIDLTESVPLINAPLVWEILDAKGQTITGKGVSVAILDTGIDYNHIDLGGCLGRSCRITHGYDFVNNDNDPMDGHGHGTHVAGIVGANGTLKGVAPDVTFHAYKVLSDQGSGSTSGIIAALERSVDPDGDINTDDAVDIINMSLSGDGSPTGPLSTATNNTVDAGVIVVVAAGNDGYYGAINSSSPANAKKAITVASSTKSDELSSFSSKATATDLFTKPEITAPGSAINSTMPKGEYASMSGTSMAAPHVAGAVALLKQNDAALTSEKAVQLLAAGAIDIGNDPLAQGPGRMDIEKSIKATTTADVTALNFGQLDSNQSAWTSTRSLTIYNHSDAVQNYRLDFTDELPNGANLSAAQSTFSIPAKSSQTIEVKLNVPNTNALAFALSRSGIYHANIVISSETASQHVPVYFEHSAKLTITTNAPDKVYVALFDDHGVSSTNFVTAEASVEVTAPSKNIWISAIYSNLDTNHIPETAGIKKLKYGLSSHQIQINDDTEFLLDANLLTNTVGLSSVTHKDGTDALPDTINYFGRSFFKTDSGSTGFISFSVKPTHIYFAIGELSDYLDLEISSQFKIAESANENGYYIYRNNITDGISISEELNLDLNSLGSTEVKLPPQSNANSLIVSDGFNLKYVESLSNQISKLNIYEPAQDNSIEYTQVTLLDINYDNGDERALITSPFFDLNESGQLRSSNDTYNYLGTTMLYESNTIDLSGDRTTYFSGIISINETTLEFANSDWNRRLFFADSQNNLYDITASYSFYCESSDGSRTLLSNGYVSIREPNIPKPSDTCEKLLFNLTNSSDLTKPTNSSVLSFYVNEQDTVIPIDQINLLHGEQLYVHPVVNKIDSTIDLTSSFGLKISSVEIRLNGGDWQPLTMVQNENGGTSVPVELVEGDFIADLRITSITSFAEAASYTLNNFFKFGTDSGEVNDADNDGIPNVQDPDDDNDGYNDDVDAFPFNSKEWIDTDGDGLGDNADTDDDNDGYLDTEDAFPLDPTEWLDTDGDGIGNNTDTDDDGDGHLDEEDVFPLDSNEWVDTDGDGTGNNADSDDDNDGVNDVQDAYPLDASRSSAPTNNTADNTSASGGGSLPVFGLIGLFLVSLVRRIKR
ncbi:S8 family serine peptidase [Pseudoalteromonas xiamenensis]|uniref:S8 family peptidase n=1 Tax=Pseudoalteromonas xiamenensis TaxID=882626 RepID=UPI0035E73D69